MSDLAVGALAGRVDRRVWSDKRAQVTLRPAPGHVMPPGGKCIADGHSRPDAGYQRDDDEKEPGHTIIVTQIDMKWQHDCTGCRYRCTCRQPGHPPKTWPARPARPICRPGCSGDFKPRKSGLR